LNAATPVKKSIPYDRGESNNKPQETTLEKKLREAREKGV
jgi:hypothetical protein